MTPGREARADAPIGVFDSGIGGLSVLRALREALPLERIVYLADSAWTPYGERGDDVVRGRAETMARHLRTAHGAKALVMACNTASAVAAGPLREAYPGWPIVAMEPPLLPAARHTRSGHVMVLATRGTLASGKYAALRRAAEAARPELRVTDIACDGLAAAIEHGALVGDASGCGPLLDRYLAPLLNTGAHAPPADTLVLGCTHYPLVAEQIRARAPSGVALLDAGAPVARQMQRLLREAGLMRAASAPHPPLPVRLLATGEVAKLQAAAHRWLGSSGEPLAVELAALP